MALLPLGRRWPEGPDEGPCEKEENKAPPHQFGRMTYDRAFGDMMHSTGQARGRKSWPHVLSPEGRGNQEPDTIGHDAGRNEDGEAREACGHGEDRQAAAVGLRRGARALARGGAGGARRRSPTRSNRSGIEVQAALHARGLAGAEATLHGGAGLPGPAADDARHLRHHASRPHLDAAPADRARRAGGLQRAAEDHPGARRHRRLADPVQLGLSRLRRRRGAARDPGHLRRRR